MHILDPSDRVSAVYRNLMRDAAQFFVQLVEVKEQDRDVYNNSARIEEISDNARNARNEEATTRAGINATLLLPNNHEDTNPYASRPPTPGTAG